MEPCFISFLYSPTSYSNNTNIYISELLLLHCSFFWFFTDKLIFTDCLNVFSIVINNVGHTFKIDSTQLVASFCQPSVLAFIWKQNMNINSVSVWFMQWTDPRGWSCQKKYYHGKTLEQKCQSTSAPKSKLGSDWLVFSELITARPMIF